MSVIAGWLARLRQRVRAPARDPEGFDLVVIDTETSGLDIARDRLLSIGAVGVRDGVLDFADSYHALLRQEAPTHGADILIHCIGTGQQAHGEPPAQVLQTFAAWCAGRWAVGYHAEFDRRMLERACREAGQPAPAVAGWMDLAVLAPALLPERRVRGRRPASLDDWLDSYGIDEVDRHDALGDAVATAQLLLPVLQAARARGLISAAALAAEGAAAGRLRELSR